jgi:hypothetical protein
MTALQVGDVALDLAQGRPTHVVADTGLTAAEWSEANDYDLVDNYGNSRFDAAPDDRVYDVVYCSSLKSEPSKTYAFPESRLGRVETEAADGGEPVADRVRAGLLADLFAEAHHIGNGDLTDALTAVASAVVDDEMVARARRGE